MSKPVITHRLEVGVAEPDVDTSDLSVLWRAFYGSAPPSVPAPTAVREASLTFTRGGHDVFKDRPIFIYVDGELWGRLRHEQQLSRAIAPGRHRVRVFNTLFSRTMDVDVTPGEQVRLRCGNGFPKAGWLLMMFLHVTYLHVHLEREPATA